MRCSCRSAEGVLILHVRGGDTNIQHSFFEGTNLWSLILFLHFSTFEPLLTFCHPIQVFICMKESPEKPRTFTR